METTIYTLPAHWAPALINGDLTGLNENDEEAMMTLIAGEELPDPLSIVGDDQPDGPYPEFKVHHDARPYGVLACDCFDYVFPAN